MTKRLDYEIVKAIFEKGGCVLLSPKYKNSQTKLDYICSCGNESSISLGNFRAGKRCWDCRTKKIAKTQTLTYGEVVVAFKDANCQLISPTYENSKQMLDYICSCGQPATITWNKFQQGQRCGICARDRLADKFRHSLEKVKLDIANRGYCLLGDYKNARTPLHICCDKGHETFTMTYDNIMRGEGCPMCTGRRQLDIDTARAIFVAGNCKLLAETYVNNSTLMPYICSCGRQAKITLANFEMGKRCRTCAIEKNSGKEHPWYNPSLTDEERQDKRAYDGYYRWRNEVFHRDNFTCVVCKSYGVYLQAHHLNSYRRYTKLRTLVNNGVTLCWWCHKVFHSHFGRNTVEEDFFVFLEDFHGNSDEVFKLKLENPNPKLGRKK